MRSGSPACVHGMQGNCALQTTTCLYFATVLCSARQTHAHTLSCTQPSFSLGHTALNGTLTGTGMGEALCPPLFNLSCGGRPSKCIFPLMSRVHFSTPLETTVFQGQAEDEQVCRLDLDGTPLSLQL
uniref:Uncharacterized protein n=1 Tax=Molossus molossus TaxID=27622 RepID=A0A7J8J0F1_MOLMO|nr:hypothetical protein HJG59_010291 [Molossus molossus]